MRPLNAIFYMTLAAGGFLIYSQYRFPTSKIPRKTVQPPQASARTRPAPVPSVTLAMPSPKPTSSPSPTSATALEAARLEKVTSLIAKVDKFELTPDEKTFAEKLSKNDIGNDVRRLVVGYHRLTLGYERIRIVEEMVDRLGDKGGPAVAEITRARESLPESIFSKERKLLKTMIDAAAKAAKDNPSK
jgi:hypothetical protein